MHNTHAPEIDKRVFLSLSDLSSLCADLPLEAFNPHEEASQNEYYGMATILKQFVGLPHEYALKGVYHHGCPIFESHIWKANFALPTNFVWAPAGVEAFSHHSDAPTYAIGPIIHYAQNYYTKRQIESEKKRLGKNAIIFPTHSSHFYSTNFDTNIFLERIHSIKKNFDTVRICLYWKDYISGYQKIFMNQGYECVTAGHIFDPFFFPRLKALLSVASHSYGNALGTQIGLSIYMGVPYTHWQDKINFPEIPNEIFSGEKFSAADKSILDDILKTFEDELDDINEDQFRLCAWHWGLDSIKTRDELLLLFYEAECRYRNFTKKFNPILTCKKKIFRNFKFVIKELVPPFLFKLLVKIKKLVLRCFID